jgi:CheY-like chemotaxis protein
LHRHRELLLHIEDDTDDAMLIGLALQKAGLQAEVRVVQNGEQAVSYLLGRPPFAELSDRRLPGLILLDLNTPVMNGHQFLQWLQLQKTLMRIPVVVLTSSAAEADIDAAYDAGANAFLTKPLDHAELTRMLADLQSFWFGWNRTSN